MLTKRKRDTRGDANSAPRVEADEEGGRLAVRLSGTWTTKTIRAVDGEMRALEGRGEGAMAVDLSGIERIDTAGAWLIERLVASNDRQGVKTAIAGASTAVETLLGAVSHTAQESAAAGKPARARIDFLAFFESVGRTMYAALDDFLAAMHILGSTIRGAQLKLGRSSGVNVAAIIHQIDRMGVGAIPVVVLMSAIVGAIVAQQGAYQLRYFGAEIFVVDLVGILILREMGVLMTAIMVAGRSGSAITAEIGSMKMREEVDALTVIGLNPVGVLVFPRLVALVIALPCLTVIASGAALGGAMAISWAYSGITPLAFIDRLRPSIDLSTVFAGLIKAPFMALIIGIIASVEGMKVKGSAESLGRHVTASVVKSIFIVVILDGFFAIFYAAIDF
ncbi:MAG: ABC transporter permease [Rhizobiales bacterium]|nr:ABC transporter permease [Hyphomicrobiales bacterium]